MAQRMHRYGVQVTWTGHRGVGTTGYQSYGREHVIEAAGKQGIAGSSDPAFRGDPACWNPEELLLASLATCHQLWMLHLCADAGIVCTGYEDRAEGTMVEGDDGGGRFTEVVLRPHMTLGDPAAIERAHALHERAHALCFIANSVNFPVRCEPTFAVATIAGSDPRGDE